MQSRNHLEQKPQSSSHHHISCQKELPELKVPLQYVISLKQKQKQDIIYTSRCEMAPCYFGTCWGFSPFLLDRVQRAFHRTLEISCDKVVFQCKTKDSSSMVGTPICHQHLGRRTRSSRQVRVTWDLVIRFQCARSWEWDELALRPAWIIQADLNKVEGELRFYEPLCSVVTLASKKPWFRSSSQHKPLNRIGISRSHSATWSAQSQTRLPKKREKGKTLIHTK